MSASKRCESGRFKPGVSGNPGGRPAGLEEIRQLAQQHAPEAIQKLVDHMRSKDERVSIAACNALLDRGYGKPLQTAELTGPAAATTFALTAPWMREVMEARGSAGTQA